MLLFDVALHGGNPTAVACTGFPAGPVVAAPHFVVEIRRVGIRADMIIGAPEAVNAAFIPPALFEEVIGLLEIHTEGFAEGQEELKRGLIHSRQHLTSIVGRVPQGFSDSCGRKVPWIYAHSISMTSTKRDTSRRTPPPPYQYNNNFFVWGLGSGLFVEYLS